MCKKWELGRVPWDAQKNDPLMKLWKKYSPAQLSIDLLTPDRLRNAWFHRGETQNLDNFFRKLERGCVGMPASCSVSIAVVGGSMTDGHELPKGAVPWPTLLVNNLRRLYPQAPQIKMHNLGVGGSSSQACLQQIVNPSSQASFWKKIDL